MENNSTIDLKQFSAETVGKTMENVKQWIALANRATIHYIDMKRYSKTGIEQNICQELLMSDLNIKLID